MFWNKICSIFEKLKLIVMFSIFGKKVAKEKTTDLDLIQVNSAGGFYMSSKNIFNNKAESLQLITDVESVIQKYQTRTVKYRTKKK